MSVMHRGEPAGLPDTPAPPSAGTGTVPAPAAAESAPRVRATPVSVAICTRGRPPELRRALESVSAQEPPAAQILVVDHAPPDDATETLVREAFPHVTYVREPALGLGFARNRALREASQEVVSFLDDDVILEQGALARIVKAFLDAPRAAACTGRVFPLSLRTPGQRLFEANRRASRGARRVHLPRDFGRRLRGLPAPRIAWSVNVGGGSCLAVRRTVALFLGGFDEAFDLGPVLPGGGDHDLIWRMLEAGHEVVYEPEVNAGRPHRTSVDGAIVQIAGHEKALVAFLTKALRGARPAARLSIAAYLAWRLVKPGVRLLAGVVGRDPLPPGAILEMWGACGAGLSAYRRGVDVARERRQKTGA